MIDLIGLVENVIIFNLIIILPLIYIRIRGKKESSQYQERPSQDWKDTASYLEEKEYLKVMQIDKELEKNKKKKEDETIYVREKMDLQPYLLLYYELADPSGTRA